MRGMFDFSSWASLATTVFGLLFMTLLMMGVRMLFMHTIQKRRERENRQINERLRALMAAYKVLGGSFTGNLTVSPLHLRDARTLAQTEDAETEPSADSLQPDDDDLSPAIGGNTERQRRTRDAVEAALSDIILLGTEEQVRMAAQAAQDMVAGNPVQTAALVTSLRQFIREALYLEAIPSDVYIPNQGPLRPNTSNSGGSKRGGNAEGNGNRSGGGGSGHSGSGGMGMGLGMGMRRDDGL